MVPFDEPEYFQSFVILLLSPIFASIVPAPLLAFVLYVATIFVTLVNDIGDVPFAPVEVVVTWIPLLLKLLPS